MARHFVQLRVECSGRPTHDDLAFLGPLRATATTRDNVLTVCLDVDATDVADALSQARFLVTERIPGEVKAASVIFTEGMRFPPGRFFRRRRF